VQWAPGSRTTTGLPLSRALKAHSPELLPPYGRAPCTSQLVLELQLWFMQTQDLNNRLCHLSRDVFWTACLCGEGSVLGIDDSYPALTLYRKNFNVKSHISRPCKSYPQGSQFLLYCLGFLQSFLWHLRVQPNQHHALHNPLQIRLAAGAAGSVPSPFIGQTSFLAPVRHREIAWISVCRGLPGKQGPPDRRLSCLGQEPSRVERSRDDTLACRAATLHSWTGNARRGRTAARCPGRRPGLR